VLHARLRHPEVLGNLPLLQVARDEEAADRPRRLVPPPVTDVGLRRVE